jgi:BirA family biotin operon repressor/biotin-[acetyl-CoA-carboxylase] ligase
LRFGLSTQIKWPNDIYVKGSKIGGILIEQQLKGSQLDWCILGCGINVNESPELKQATCLYQETGQRFKPLTVLTEYLDLLNGQQALLYGDFLKLKNLFEDCMGFRNQQLQFEKKDSLPFEGVILGVNEQGQLQLEVNGLVQNYSNQEIRFLLPST